MTSPLQKSIARQRTSLFNMLVEPMAYLAWRCAEVWQDKAALDQVLNEGIKVLPSVGFLYAMDLNGLQVSDNASRKGPIAKDFGRDRSQRPYMMEPVPQSGLLLSQAYISLRAKRPSLTAVQRVKDLRGAALGYLGADFDLRDLPLTRELYQEPTGWQQIKGDPAIRGQVFQQQRVDSLLDQPIDDILPVMEELITSCGVFHSKIHFSSSRATVWLMDDPYRYRIMGYEALSDPDVCLAYPHRQYTPEAVIPDSQIKPILNGFRRLRFADDIIYLRAGSLNIFNGMISLNFSCDGSHYLPYKEFLAEDSPFWQSVV
jgi:hypothetical protein